jgi:extracellular elastinolytic metalloproteinase
LTALFRNFIYYNSHQLRMNLRSTLGALCLFAFSLSPLCAQVKNPLDIAAKYLQHSATELGLTTSDVMHYQLSSQHVSKHNKLTHVYLEQTWSGIPVVNAIFNLNIHPDGSILYAGNRFLPSLSERVNTTQPRLTAEQAISAFAQQMQLPVVSKWTVQEAVNDRELVFAPQGQALEPVRVKLVYQPLADKTVRLAWQVSYYPLDAEHWWLAAIDAVSGELIDIFDQVLHCNFSAAGECKEGHVHEHAGHQQVAVGSSRQLSFFNVEVGTGTYNAYPLTVESPNHGSRQLLSGPADSLASPFGWHDMDGQLGAEYTITRGNNVHAYNDILNQNRSIGDEPDGGAALVFDHPIDFASNRPYTYRDALVTNLFYWNNLMHDLWYNYGFDEAAGNFQAINYRGAGDGGDYVQAEALDGSGTNNANFATPTDGQRPRMQMYLWGGSLPSLVANLETRTADGSVRDFEFVQLSFGGDLPSAESPLEAQAALADDGVGNGADVCEPIVNAADLVGKVALIDRGDCEFGFKALAGQEAGAIAVVICNNEDTPIFAGGPGAVGDQVTIPVVMVSRANCNTMKMDLENGLEIMLVDQPLAIPEPGPTGRSSDLDNGVIAHEYTHGISIRLTGGRNNSSCLRNVEQAGEGWSDWFGMVMATTPEMTANQRRGVGTYSANQPTNGRGIRPYPYSRSMNVNPHTYQDINSESIPHGVGSVWCAMIWDLYWNLIDEHGYDEDLFKGTGGNNIAMQLVLDGLKIQPCNPSFVESRDAILAADEINNNGANRCLIWETFARRGLGVDAQEGGVESFDTPVTCLNAFVVQKRAVEEAFAGETITYELEITNGKSINIDSPLLVDTLPVGATLIPESVSCNYTQDGNILRFELDALPSGTFTSCSYAVQTNPEEFSYVAFFDGLESGLGNFTTAGDLGPQDSWRRVLNTAYEGRFSWSSQNPDFASDQSLLTVPLELPAGERPGLSFFHRFTTEEGWDGGVVEMTTDGGANWIDMGSYMIKNRYSGRLNDSESNVLSGRRAFTGSTAGDWIETIIDLEAFAGEEVQFRFRFGTDEGTAEEGWFVDNVTLYGNLYSITNVACAQDEEGEFCSEATTVIFGMPTSTEEVAAELPLRVFPNPASSRLQVRFGEEMSGALQLSLVNLAGQRVLAEQFPATQQVELRVDQLPAGIYFLQVQSDTGSASRKVIIR